MRTPKIGGMIEQLIFSPPHMYAYKYPLSKTAVAGYHSTQYTCGWLVQNTYKFGKPCIQVSPEQNSCSRISLYTCMYLWLASAKRL